MKLRVIWARLVGLFRRGELDREIDEELRFHVEMRTQENIARGMAPAAAAQQARRQLGNVNLIKDACRDVSGGGALEILAQDVRFAARMLLKDRVFTAVAVLALALGIGANTALFTVLSDVLLRPLPYPRAAEIMAVSMRDNSNPRDSFPLSFPDFADLRAQTRAFSGFGAFRSSQFVLQTNGGEARQVRGAWVTSDIFPLIGVKPAIGRAFTRKEDEPGRRAVVISYELWENHFGKAANVTKAPLTINGREFTVVGVMPAGFHFPVQNERAQFWITFASELEPLPDGTPSYPFRRDSHFLHVIGRLKPGFTPADAEADLTRIAASLAEKYPETNRDYAASIVRPWLEEITRRVRPMLLMLIGAAVFVLCVACANVANLLLARANARRKEIALRAALGAGRGRILRQLLTESLLLASTGGVAGLFLALAATRYIVSALPRDFPRAAEIVPDVRVLAFTGIVTLLTSCLFGLAPGWRSARAKLTPLLNDAGQGPGETPRGRRARSALVVAEMLLAFVLLAGACFFIANLARVQSSPLGFNPEHVLTAEVFVPDELEPDVSERAVAFFNDLLGRASQMPKVQAASFVSRLPLSASRSLADFEIAGRPMHRADLPLAEPHIISPDYFRTMEIPIRSGRDFDARDTEDAPQVVIVNQLLAERFFPGENPIGKRITPGIFVNSTGAAEREIVGVVGNVQSDMLAVEQRPQVYLPLPQCTLLDLTLVVRSDAAPDELLREIEAIAAEINPNVAVQPAPTMSERVARNVAVPRLNSTLLAAFAALAVVLTAIGVYGVTTYSVAQRQHEIGIRLALGAQKRAVFRLVIGEAVRLIGWALVAGGISTAIALPVLQVFAHGEARNEIIILLVPAVLLAGVGLLACWLPARRAAALDPLVALGQRP